MEFSRQGYWSGLPFPSPGDLPDPRIKPGSPALQAVALLFDLLGKLPGVFFYLFCFLQKLLYILASPLPPQNSPSELSERLSLLLKSVDESESEVAQSCPTLWNPLDYSLPGSSVHGIFQARVLEWVVISFSRGSSQPRDRTRVSRTADWHFTVWATREAPK